MESSDKFIIELRKMFEDNFEMIRLDSGHALTAYTKEQAWKQVLWYWQKLGYIAKSVTETEHKITLPLQKTLKGRHFTIEGIVDILCTEGTTWMYDIKTHDLEYILSNLNLYEEQLNIYAYVYQKIKQLKLDHIGIISTNIPKDLVRIMRTGNDDQIKKALDEWHPVVEMDFTTDNIEATISNFANVVDAIEDKSFTAPPLEKLKAKVSEHSSVKFATRVCSNCDARFSCPSYRAYLQENQYSYDRSQMKKYLIDLPNEDPEEQEDWTNANLENKIEQITANA
jgi:hypothetical protein